MDDQRLSQQQLVALLDQWVGREVAVRVVSSGDDLLAVFQGRLGPRTAAKAPALFWPLAVTGEQHAEQPGLYLHPEWFQDATAHEGKFVLELRQNGVTLNIRRL
jgi:hypothetical protein